MKTYTSSSPDETKKIARDIARKISNGTVALSGDLGSGKTTFVQGFAEGLGIKDKIISPTFVLIRQHQLPKSKRILYHIDLYRLEDPLELKNIGLEEIIENPNNIVLIEWAEKAKKLLPKNTIWINFKNLSENTRELIFK